MCPADAVRGQIVGEGIPEEVGQTVDSHTGRYLRDLPPDVELEGPRADREMAAPSADD